MITEGGVAGGPVSDFDEPEIPAPIAEPARKTTEPEESGEKPAEETPVKRWRFGFGRKKASAAEPEKAEEPATPKPPETPVEYFKETFLNEFEQLEKVAGGDEERLMIFVREALFMKEADRLAHQTDEGLTGLNSYLETRQDRRAKFWASTRRRALVKAVVSGIIISAGVGIAVATGGTVVPMALGLAGKAFGMGAIGSFSAGTAVDAAHYGRKDPNRARLAEIYQQRHEEIRRLCQRVVRANGDDGFFVEDGNVIRLAEAKSDLFVYVSKTDSPDSPAEGIDDAVLAENQEIRQLREKLATGERAHRWMRMGASILGGLAGSSTELLTHLKGLIHDIGSHGFEMHGNGLGATLVQHIKESHPNFVDPHHHFVHLADEGARHAPSGVVFNVDQQTNAVIDEAVRTHSADYAASGFHADPVLGGGMAHDVGDVTAQLFQHQAESFANEAFSGVFAGIVADGLSDSLSYDLSQKKFSSWQDAHDEISKEQLEVPGGKQTVADSVEFEKTERTGVGRELELKEDEIVIEKEKLKKDGTVKKISHTYTRDNNRFILTKIDDHGNHIIAPMTKNPDPKIMFPAGDPFSLSPEDFEKWFEFVERKLVAVAEEADEEESIEEPDKTSISKKTEDESADGETGLPVVEPEVEKLDDGKFRVGGEDYKVGDSVAVFNNSGDEEMWSFRGASHDRVYVSDLNPEPGKQQTKGVLVVDFVRWQDQARSKRLGTSPVPSRYANPRSGTEVSVPEADARQVELTDEQQKELREFLGNKTFDISVGLANESRSENLIAGDPYLFSNKAGEFGWHMKYKGCDRIPVNTPARVRFKNADDSLQVTSGGTLEVDFDVIGFDEHPGMKERGYERGYFFPVGDQDFEQDKFEAARKKGNAIVRTIDGKLYRMVSGIAEDRGGITRYHGVLLDPVTLDRDAKNVFVFHSVDELSDWYVKPETAPAVSPLDALPRQDAVVQPAVPLPEPAPEPAPKPRRSRERKKRQEAPAPEKPAEQPVEPSPPPESTGGTEPPAEPAPVVEPEPEMPTPEAQPAPPAYEKIGDGVLVRLDLGDTVELLSGKTIRLYDPTVPEGIEVTITNITVPETLDSNSRVDIQFEGEDKPHAESLAQLKKHLEPLKNR